MVMSREMTSLASDSSGARLKGIRGSLLSFKADPFINGGKDCYDYLEDGLVVIQNGRIIDVGNYSAIVGDYPLLNDIDTYSDSLIMPGFIDCHVHYVQAPMIASPADGLLDWLDKCVFPTEAKFNDKAFADEVARVFFAQLLEQGTTTANVFATVYSDPVDAFFEESERYDTRMIAGKVLQDRNLPDELRDVSAEASIEATEKLLRKWHGRGRQLYAIIPRFAPTSTPRQLQLAGELYQRYVDRGVFMHTHLDEEQGEIDRVATLFPDQPNYAEVYNRFGLLGRRSVMAHCCIVREEEWQMLHDKDCGVAHCPSSNLFLGDGRFKYWEAKNCRRPLRVGIGTDVGGGTDFSILRQLGDAYKVGMLKRHSLDAVKSFYLATRGGAETLHLENTIGSLAPGYEADIAVLDLKPTRFASWRMKFADSVFDKLFVLMTLGLNNVNRATYVAGRKVYDRNRNPRLMYAAELDAAHAPQPTAGGS